MSEEGVMNLKRSDSVRASAVLFLTMGLAVFGGPQDQKQRPLRYDTAAVVKLVPVRVLDAEGRPVRGLTKTEFALADNGELRPITEFEVHESGERGIPPERARSAAGPVPPEFSRRIFFVLDMQGSDLFGNKDAKKTVLAFVKDNLMPGDEASVMTFGANTGLVLRQYLTPDFAKIESAIRRSIEMSGGSGGSRGGGFAGDVTNMQPVGGESAAIADAGAISAAPFGYDAEGLSIEVPSGQPAGSARSKEDFDRSMSELATAMKFIPGSKSVVYFSTRVPGGEVGRLFAEANATVFAVNTNSVLRGGPTRIKKLKEQQGEALRDFSESSGGRYFSDVRDARKLAADIEVLSGTYYVLGYYVSPSWDGRLHTITVTVDRPDLQVLAQAGYNDPKPYAALSELEKKLQLFDLLLSDEPVGTEALDFPVRVLQGSATEEANAAVLLKLTVDERTGVPPGTAELYVLIFDAEHKIVLAERAELDTRSIARKTLHPYLLTKLPQGDYECRVAARDKGTGLALTSRAPFSVPAPAGASRCSLSSPLLLVPSEKPEFARMSRPPKKGRRPASILDFYPYLPVRFVPLLEDLPEEAEQVWVLLPFKSGVGQPAKPDLQVRLIGVADGKDVPVEWSLLDTQRREPDLTFFLIRIDVRRVGLGSYRLDFLAADPSSGASSSISAALVRR
jgi:VWFA-related protein